MKIVKRDGRKVDYDRDKIVIAISKANKEVGGKDKISRENNSIIWLSFINWINRKMSYYKRRKIFRRSIQTFISKFRKQKISLQIRYIKLFNKLDIHHRKKI